ncbi:hypothetical protein ACPF8X_26975 [Streptomyces sp. G35A]
MTRTTEVFQPLRDDDPRVAAGCRLAARALSAARCARTARETSRRSSSR